MVFPKISEVNITEMKRKAIRRFVQYSKLLRLLARFKILKIVDMLFIKKNNKYIVVPKKQYGYKCNVRLIAEALALNNKDVTVFWEGNLEPMIERDLIKKGIRFINKYNLSYIFHLVTSKNLLLSHSIRDAYLSYNNPKRNVINLWHGVPIKNIEQAIPKYEKFQNHQQTSIKKQNNVLVASSITDQTAMAKCFGLAKSNVWVTGLPRYDYLLDKVVLPSDLLVDESELLKLLSGRKLILYAPTFRTNQTGSVFTEELKKDLLSLADFCSGLGLVFGIRSHISDPVGRLFNDNKILNLNSIIIQETNLLLKHVDCLITDFSSIWIDYLLLNRPIICFAQDKDDYLLNDRGVLYPFDKIFPEPFVDSVECVKSRLLSLHNNGSWVAHYHEQLEMFHTSIDLNENYTNRVVESILNHE
ncbi:MAG: CDP-glycerol glycerophosphotransferase (TagB/SpsB family) [Psychromonas sp.]|jgi:CDP-glycerol glycerophosphotransferase (TagB/SpsB family)|uniref:CDP-glycerol glycerophosphotransferase family protein n=1 Tax=Psychromonas sp. TaxID=1884585 RepID=UPI0039E533E2